MRRSIMAILCSIAVAFVLLTGCGRSPREEIPPPATENLVSDEAAARVDQAELPDAGGNEQDSVKEVVGQHFSCVTRTGNNATIGVPNSISISGPAKMEAGDELAVFTPDGFVCVGSVIWNGNNQAITAWGDDTQTEAIDGLQVGEEFQLRLWDQSEASEYSAVAGYEMGDGIYQVDGIYIVQHLAFEESGPGSR